MAYLMDQYGNSYPDQAMLDEEERRRREEEAERQRQEALMQTGTVSDTGGVPTQTLADFTGGDTGLLPSEVELQAVEPKAPGDTVAEKQETTTYADGSQTQRLTREIPAEPQEPSPEPAQIVVAGPIAPPPSGGFQPPPPVITPQTQPAIGGNSYADRIAQEESGGNPNIGLHAPGKSTAYGMYGITDRAWQGAQEANPALRGIRKEDATPEQMRQGFDTVTQNNARYLRNYGVDVNDNTLAAAHFIGARGLRDYMRDGTISEGAARANGGYERTRQVIESRLSGGPGPASAAVMQAPPAADAPPPKMATADVQRPSLATPGIQSDQAAQAQPVSPYSLAQGQTGEPGLRAPGQPAGQPAQSSADAIQRYQDLQNDPIGLFALREDATQPEFIRKRAGDRVANLLQEQQKTAQATEAAKQMLESGDSKGIARVMASGGKDEFRSIMRSMFLRMMGANKAADEELSKIGYGNKAEIGTNDAGKRAQIEYDAAGRVRGGITEDGQQLSATEAIGYSSGGKWNTTAEMFQDKNGNIYQAQNNDKGKTRFVNTKTNAVYSGSENLQRLRDVSATAKMNQQLVVDLAKKHGQNVLDAEKDFVALNGPFGSASNPATREDFRQAYGYNLATPAQAPAPAPAPAQAPAPQAAPVAPPAQAPGAVAPVVPGAVPGQAAPAPAPAPGAVAPTPLPPARTAPAASVSQPLEAQRDTQKVGAKEREAFVAKEGTKEQIGVSASDGAIVANVRRQQMDVIKSNPSIINILNGQGTQYDRARRIMINAVTGSYSSEEKQRMADDLNQLVGKLDPGQLGALQEFVNMNTVVNAKTLRANSGPGAVSEAEQRANKEANIGNVDRIEVYAALAGLNRSQFTGDLNASKQAFLAGRPDIQTTTQWNSEWQKRESELMRQYQSIAKGRFEIMGKAPGAKASPQEMAAYRDRVFRAFEVYPAPSFDPGTNRWNYGTPNARRRAMDAALGR